MAAAAYPPRSTEANSEGSRAEDQPGLQETFLKQ